MLCYRLLTILVLVTAGFIRPALVDAQPPAQVPKTGQKTSLAAVDDGNLREGIAWPIPRFTDNRDGTVTDHLTGLMWLREGNCIGKYEPSFDTDGTAGDGFVHWQHALDFVKALNEGSRGCGWDPGKGPFDDWRLPNIRELLSLHALEFYAPAISNAKGTGQLDADLSPQFLDVAAGWYWSSTSLRSYPGRSYAWVMPVSLGSGLCKEKASEYQVWPVRGPVKRSTIAIPKTGQTSCSDQTGTEIDCTNTGQDGELQKGVEWPSPRFTDQLNGTVTDNLTGLVWLKNAMCFHSARHEDALVNCGALASGACGLSDGSVPGDWRLPNANELFSLLDLGSSTTPVLPSGHPFANVLKYQYWTSTRSPQAFETWAFFVHMHEAQLSASGLVGTPYFTWPVRNGPPLVSVTAPDPRASEAGNPGQFEIARTGDTGSDLIVWCRVKGSAANGIDYKKIPRQIRITAGKSKRTVQVKPIGDEKTEGKETVKLVLITAPSGLYGIGVPNHATVRIVDKE